MRFSFRIGSDASFAASKSSGCDSIREKLFGKPLQHKGITTTLPQSDDMPAVEPDHRPAKLLRRTPKTLHLGKCAAVADGPAEQKPGSEPVRRRVPVEYLGHLITNEQQADGKWVASFLRMGDSPDCAHRSAPNVASYTAFADAKRQIDAILQKSAADNRELLRVPVALEGMIFAGGSPQECQIMDLSAGGARLRRNSPIILAGELLLYIKGFGRFRAQVVRSGDTEVAVRFIVDNDAVQALLNGLANYVKGLASAQTKLRKEVRIPTSIAAVCRMPDGAAISCEIIDASMGGMSIRIGERPSIGALVTLGRTKFRVVRHHSQGIAVQRLPPPSAKSGRYVFKED
jgi:hypothetical protein